MKKERCLEKVFVVMLSFVMLIGVAACGNSNKQADVETGAEPDVFSEPVTAEPESESDMETEISENATDAAETAGNSNILIAYFSRVGNMDFDEDIDAVTSASVNMDGSDVYGNAQLLAEMAREVTGGDLFFIETVEKYPAEYRGTTDQAKTEQNDDARPELSSHVENMDAYDTIVLIYPKMEQYFNCVLC